MQAKPPHPRRVFSSSPGGSLPRGPHQIRTWRFPPSGSSADVARGSRATTVRSCGDMIRRRRSAGHGSLRTITPTRAAFARPGPGGYPFPGVIARMQPSDSLIPIGLGSGRPLPSAYPGARATRSNEGLPGVRAVLFQRAVVVDPAGCGALLAHGAGPAVAFRLHEALGTQEDVVSRLQGLRPTRSRTYASATALPRSPQGSLPAWVGWPLTGRGSHPLDDTQGFMTYSSIPLDRPAWPHHATTPASGIQPSGIHPQPGPGGCSCSTVLARPVAACATIAGRFVSVGPCVSRGAQAGGVRPLPPPATRRCRGAVRPYAGTGKMKRDPAAR